MAFLETRVNSTSFGTNVSSVWWILWKIWLFRGLKNNLFIYWNICHFIKVPGPLRVNLTVHIKPQIIIIGKKLLLCQWYSYILNHSIFFYFLFFQIKKMVDNVKVWYLNGSNNDFLTPENSMSGLWDGILIKFRCFSLNCLLNVTKWTCIHNLTMVIHLTRGNAKV